MKKFATLVAIAVCFLVGGNALRADDAKQDGKFYLDTATGSVSQRLDVVEKRLDAIEKKLDAVLTAKAGNAAPTVGGPIVNPNWSPPAFNSSAPKTKKIQVCNNGRCEIVEVPDTDYTPSMFGSGGPTPPVWSVGSDGQGTCGSYACPANGGGGNCPCVAGTTSTFGGFQSQPAMITYSAAPQVQYRTGLFGRSRAVRGTTCGPGGCQ